MVNQHIADSYPMEWWSTRFAQAVGDFGCINAAVKKRASQELSGTQGVDKKSNVFG